MSSQTDDDIFLFVFFNWPENITPELTANARKIHNGVKELDWIEEVASATSGLGDPDFEVVWVFRMRGYEHLKMLFHDSPVTKPWQALFNDLKGHKMWAKEKIKWHQI